MKHFKIKHMGALALSLLLIGCISPTGGYKKAVEEGSFGEVERFFSIMDEKDRIDAIEFTGTLPQSTIAEIENEIATSIDHNLVKGEFESARLTASNGLAILENSELLSQKQQEINKTEAEWEAFKNRWSHSQQPAADFNEVQNGFDESKIYEAFNINLHPAADQLADRFTQEAYLKVSNSIKKGDYKEIEERFEWMAYNGMLPATEYESCRSTVVYELTSGNSSSDTSNELIAAIGNQHHCVLEFSGTAETEPWLLTAKELFESTMASLALDLLPVRYRQLTTKELRGEDLNALEHERSRVPVEYAAEFDSMLINGHLSQAERFVGLDKGAMLAMLHAARAQTLSQDVQERVRSLIGNGLRTISSSSDFQLDIVLNPGRSIDPSDYEFLYDMILSSITSRTQEPYFWNAAPKGYTQSDRQIEIRDLEYTYPDESSLRRVTSSYYSHDISVPNVRKQQVKRQLNTAKFSLSMAENSYDLAVSTYNINPTSFNYNNAQNSYNSYARVLKSHNAIVREYNATPDTVLVPHYEPYVFYEGNLSHGWAFSIAIIDNEQTELVNGRSVNTSFTRIGTDYRDRNSSYRRDVPHTLDTNNDGSVSHFVSAMNQVTDQLEAFIGNSVTIPYSAGITDYEYELLKEILHPWGTQDTIISNSPWVEIAAESIDLEDLTFDRQTHSLGSGVKVRARGDAQSMAGELIDSIVFIIAESPSGTGTSTGAIIREDGLILTTAHSLPGATLSVEVGDGPSSRRYPASIVEINHNKDVALIKIDSETSSFRALPIRLTQPTTRGESVIAMGNPSLDDRSISRNSITQGIVANPITDEYYSQRIVADVTIASGSSGGPLISMEDGSVVGVITAVSAPVFAQESRSSSGSFALAAPSTLLGEWLGLTQ